MSPESVSLKELADVLQQTSAVVEAVAEGEGGSAPEVVLTEVRQGSAAYTMVSPDLTFEPMLERLFDAVTSRGHGFDRSVREAMKRLFKATSRVGRASFAFEGVERLAEGATVDLTEPVVAPVLTRYGTTIYGVLVAVAMRANGQDVVQLELEEGGRLQLDCSPEIADRAKVLFKRPVVATAFASWDGETTSDWDIEDIEEREGATDLLEALDGVRRRIAKASSPVDVDAWLAEIGA